MNAARRLPLLGGTILSLLAMATPRSAFADYTVHAKGRVVWDDVDGQKPLARVRVQLMDQDLDFDEVMKRGTTNASGDYDLTGSSEDSWTVCDGCDHPDPYIKVILYEDNRVDVHNIWGFTHFGLTDTKEDTSGNLSFGQWEFDNDEEHYPALFAYVQQQYKKFNDLTGDARVPGNDGVVGVQVPEVIQFGTPWTSVDAIHWPPSYVNYPAIYHEFGHRIRHAADGSESHFLNDAILFTYARSHSMSLHSNLGYAFNEGWAEYHATLLDNGDKERVSTWTMRPHGNEVEGNVALKLYKLGQICGGFKALWAALKSGTNQSIDGGPPAAQSGIHSFQQFHTWFKQKNPGCKELLLDTDLAKGPAANLPPEPQPRVVSSAIQTAAMSKALAGMDGRGSKPLRTKWTPARLAKLPATVRAPMTRIVDRRAAHAKAHETNFRDSVRTATLALPPATEASASNGTYVRAVSAARDALLKKIGEPRLQQIAEIKADLERERKASSDRRFGLYCARLLARYTDQEREIKLALATPGSRVPESLIPRTAAASTKRVRD